MRIVLLGPPAAGKAALSKRISEHYGIPAITVGSILQRAADSDSELGRLAQEAMSSNRASDELCSALLRVQLASPEMAKGFVMVDLPKNVAQAEVINGLLDTAGRPLDAVFQLEVDRDELMERLVGRIDCDACGAHYNIYINPPMVEGVCDECGARVSRRPNDYEENISNRLRIYDGTVAPVLQFYLSQEKIKILNADLPEEEVWEEAEEFIDTLPKSDEPVVIDAGDAEYDTRLIEQQLSGVASAIAEMAEASEEELPPKKTAKELKEEKAAKKKADKLAKKEADLKEKTEKKAAAKKSTAKKAAVKKKVTAKKKVAAKKKAVKKTTK